MNAKHTPGPWLAVQHARSEAWRITLTPGNARGDLCNVLAGLGASQKEQVAANAHLIAASPEMLAMLQKLDAEGEVPQGDLLRLIAKATQGAQA